MKTNNIQITLTALLATAQAFPHMAMKMAAELAKRQEFTGTVDSDDFTGASTTVFSAADQFVSNSGAHAYVAPNFGAGDVRGPCPGLNALANHNYINHNGITTLTDAISGTTEGFNMGVDLAGFLSAYALLFDGDILTQQWSIGGPQNGVSSVLGILGAGDGLTGSHNKYETDSSPMRPDLYQYGNNYKVITSQYQELYDKHKGEPDSEVTFTFDDLSSFRNSRFTESVEQNPHFFYGPFSGFVVSQAAFTFIPAFMSNHSAEFPNGILSRQTLNSFYGVTETGGTGVGDGTLTWNAGTEKIPDNWYKRSSSVPYSIPLFVLDTLRIENKYPQITSIGGNTGTVNSFAGVDLGNLTGGVYELSTLFEGNNLQCFIFQLAQQTVLDAVKNLESTLLTTVNSLVTEYIDPNFSGLGCPTLSTIDTSLFDQYPGASTTG